MGDQNKITLHRQKEYVYKNTMESDLYDSKESLLMINLMMIIVVSETWYFISSTHIA